MFSPEDLIVWTSDTGQHKGTVWVVTERDGEFLYTLNLDDGRMVQSTEDRIIAQ